MTGKRDFTTEEAAQWAGESKGIWREIAKQAAEGRYPSLAMFIEEGVQLYRFAHLSFQEYLQPRNPLHSDFLQRAGHHCYSVMQCQTLSVQKCQTASGCRDTV